MNEARAQMAKTWHFAMAGWLARRYGAPRYVGRLVRPDRGVSRPSGSAMASRSAYARLPERTEPAFWCGLEGKHNRRVRGLYRNEEVNKALAPGRNEVRALGSDSTHGTETIHVVSRPSESEYVGKRNLVLTIDRAEPHHRPVKCHAPNRAPVLASARYGHECPSPSDHTQDDRRTVGGDGSAYEHEEPSSASHEQHSALIPHPARARLTRREGRSVSIDGHDPIITDRDLRNRRQPGFPVEA
jgi:hypothetical protein